MDLSLDDIIKKKKTILPTKNKIGVKKVAAVKGKTAFKPAARVTDARLKIIQKNRAKIRDARDKLAEMTRTSGLDARERLMKNQLAKAQNGVRTNFRNNGRLRGSGGVPMPARKFPNGLTTKGAQYRAERMMSAPVPARHPEMVVPRGYVDYDNMERMEEEEYVAATQLSRTVKNDISPYGDVFGSTQMRSEAPHPPRRLNSWSSNPEPFDPFDLYEVPTHERRLEMPLPPPKGILRPSLRQPSPPSLYERRYIPDSSHLSYEMRSRLERAPDPHASMGIFSNPLKPSSSSSSSSSGYRIVVSNLHTSVTQSDIKELFEDIGELYDSRIVRPGVAEVIYKSLKDAEKAVDTYHNRQLDGQPMKCLLVNPRSSNNPTAPAIKPASRSTSRVHSGKTPLEIDIDALHKVLFRRH